MNIYPSFGTVDIANLVGIQCSFSSTVSMFHTTLTLLTQ